MKEMRKEVMQSRHSNQAKQAAEIKKAKKQK